MWGRKYLKNKRADQAHMIAQVLDENYELKGRIRRLKVTIELLKEKLKEEKDPESMYCEVA